MLADNPRLVTATVSDGTQGTPGGIGVVLSMRPSMEFRVIARQRVSTIY
jgi:hypothetical protein